MPDFVVARTEKTLSDASRQKIHMLTGVPAERVVCSPNVGLLYELPMELQKQGYDIALCKLLGIAVKDQDLKDWRALMEKHHKATQTVRVGVVGKYAYAKDAYNSVFEAITHAGIHNGVKTDGILIDSVDLEKPGGEKILNGLDAIIIPGGFGTRGIEGKINAINYARKNDVPLLGLCYGLQLSVIEIARNELGLKDAHTTEINPDTKAPVIDMLPEQKAIQDKGGTMRLGAKDVLLKKGTQAAKLYAKERGEERPAHQQAFSPPVRSEPGVRRPPRKSGPRV
jgi:CTP synthase